jgi:hypothetical protein
MQSYPIPVYNPFSTVLSLFDVLPSLYRIYNNNSWRSSCVFRVLFALVTSL